MMHAVAMLLGGYAEAARAWDGPVRLVKFLSGRPQATKATPQLFFGKDTPAVTKVVEKNADCAAFAGFLSCRPP